MGFGGRTAGLLRTGWHLNIAERSHQKCIPTFARSIIPTRATGFVDPEVFQFAKNNLVATLANFERAVKDRRRVLRLHGPVLRDCGRKQYYVVCCNATLNWFLGGHRGKGLRSWHRALSMPPLAPKCGSSRRSALSGRASSCMRIAGRSTQSRLGGTTPPQEFPSPFRRRTSRFRPGDAGESCRFRFALQSSLKLAGRVAVENKVVAAVHDSGVNILRCCPLLSGKM